MTKDFVQLEQIVIDDLETLKIISDPLRISILEHLAKRPNTVKAIAAEMGFKPNKLYYHINLLEKHGLITLVETQVVSGIIEKWYQSTAISYMVEPELLRLMDDPSGEFAQIIDSLFGKTRAELLHTVSLNHEDGSTPLGVVLTGTVLHLTQEEEEAFTEELQALLEKYQGGDDQDPERQRYGFTVAFYPIFRREIPQDDETGEANDLDADGGSPD